MDEVRFIKRKIFLKGQAVSLIKNEEWSLRTRLFCLQMKSLRKRFVMWFFCHGLLGAKATQRAYDFLGLSAD